MARARLQEQQVYEFHCTVMLQPRDINYGGHLGNDSLVSLLGTARASLFHSVGAREADLGDGRTGIIITDLSVDFRAEAFMFDELLLDTHADGFTRSYFRLYHRITRGPTTIALAETGLVAFDYASRKVVPVPEALVAALTPGATRR